MPTAEEAAEAAGADETRAGAAGVAKAEESAAETFDLPFLLLPLLLLLLLLLLLSLLLLLLLLLL